MHSRISLKGISVSRNTTSSPSTLLKPVSSLYPPYAQHSQQPSTDFNIQKATCLIAGYEQFHSCELLLPHINSTKANELSKRLVTTVFNGSPHFSPLQRAVAARMLQLALGLDLPVKALLKYLLVGYPFSPRPPSSNFLILMTYQ